MIPPLLGVGLRPAALALPGGWLDLGNLGSHPSPPAGKRAFEQEPRGGLQLPSPRGPGTCYCCGCSTPRQSQGWGVGENGQQGLEMMKC